MPTRFLIGPVSAAFAEQHLHALKSEGRCLTFNHERGADVVVSASDSWDEIAARFPTGWSPDFLLLDLSYSFIPEGIHAAPCCRFGIAPDWRLLWHSYQTRAGDVDRIFTDPEGAARFRQIGVSQVRPATLSGGGQSILDRLSPDTPRDIDLLVVGNLNSAIHPGRAAWLPRLARIAQAWRVEFHASAAGPSLRPLLARARIVFRQAEADASDSLLHDAIAAGAIVVQNADGPPLAEDWPKEGGCVVHDGHNVEDLLRHFLKNEEERRKRVRLSQSRDPKADLWETSLLQIVEQIENELSSLMIYRLPHASMQRLDRLQIRCAQMTVAGLHSDPDLIRELEAALADIPDEPLLHHALGIAFMRRDADPDLTPVNAGVAAEHFRRTLEKEPDNSIAHLNRVEALRIAGRNDQAVLEAQQCLARLPFEPGEPAEWRDSLLARFDFGYFRMAWERAGWENAGDPLAETRAKARLIRGHLQAYLGGQSGEMLHHYEAVLACPEMSPFNSALGARVLSSGHALEATPYLAKTVAKNPFDRDAARSLFQALGQQHDTTAQRLFARDRRLFHRAMPSAVPAEAWFAECPPPVDELVSIVILCCNELDVTKLCIESVLAHTRRAFELIFINNGSNDGTQAYLTSIRTHPAPDRIIIIENETNRGFSAGCNQGLAEARGRFLLFLNNDTVVPEGWLEGLLGPMLAGWPHVGLVGPVTNYAPEPQGISISYSKLEGLESTARTRREQFAGKFMEISRVTGFCMLTRREVLQRIGSFDERFGIGFFDDDDLCLRVRQAGFKLQVALDTYIHHFGSRTFKGLGVDTRRQLQENFTRFREKWGEQHTAGYKLVELTPSGQDMQRMTAPSVADAPAVVAASRGMEVARARLRKSLSMIVKNEEKNLPDCLRSAHDLFDEIVIADTGSTDRTPEIIREFGAKLVEFPWVNSFAAARNASLEHVTGEWVMWLDADDRLDSDSHSKLMELFDQLGNEIDVYAMKVRSGLDAERQTFRLLDQVRLFPNRPGVRWDYRVHEQILPSVKRIGGGVRWTEIAIDHTGYQDSSLRHGKLERNLNLLELDLQDRPQDAFTLFNLGWTILDLGRTEEATIHLKASLDLSTPDSSITRKLYDLLAHSRAAARRSDEALDWCDRGLKVYPDDPELLLRRALLLKDERKLAEASGSLEKLLATKPSQYFASIDAGLRGYKTRHLLAALYRDQSRSSEAEVQWLASVRERPTFAPAWLALGELYIRQNRWPDVEDVAANIENLESEILNAQIMRARSFMARNDWVRARDLLKKAINHFPNQIGPRVILTHALLREGRDMPAAKQALQDVLAIDSEHQEAKNNLRILLQNHPELNRE